MGCSHNQCRNKIFLRNISKSYWKIKAIVFIHEVSIELEYPSNTYIYDILKVTTFK